MLILSLLALFTIAAVGTAGIFSVNFKENWLQFFGMFGVTVWASARFWQVLEGAYLTEQQTFMHVSLALFCLGTAKKVFKHRNAPFRWTHK